MVLAHRVDGHGPARVLVLHDWLGDAGAYDAAMPWLDLAALTSARVDLPGYGASRGHPLLGVSAALDAAVVAVADHLGWPRFHLVAHSMSTVIAQRVARSMTARLASVTLTAPVTPGTRIPDGVVDALRAMGRDPSLRPAALASMWGTRLSPQWLATKLERWAACAEPAAVEAYVDLFAQPKGLASARADVAVPVHVITGADDAPPFARAAVEPAMRAVYPDVVVDVCAGAGHYPMQETPPLYAWMVERFIRQHA